MEGRIDSDINFPILAGLVSAYSKASISMCIVPIKVSVIVGSEKSPCSY